jgi:hypothetical protein
MARLVDAFFRATSRLPWSRGLFATATEPDVGERPENDRLREKKECVHYPSG